MAQFDAGTSASKADVDNRKDAAAVKQATKGKTGW